MELRNIKTFIHAAEMESFTAAALRKNYAQSTVTQQIQAIERELGAELFVRSGRRVALSSAGRAVLGDARRVAARSGLLAGRGGRLSVGPAGHRDLEKMFMAVPTPSPTAPRSERTARTLFAEVHSSRYMCQTRAPSAVPATTSARRLLRGTL